MSSSREVRFFVRGLQTKGQSGGDEREWAACGDAGSLKPEMIACQSFGLHLPFSVAGSWVAR